MDKKFFIFLLIIFYITRGFCFAQSLSSEYLCSIAIALYKEGRTEEALREFEKVLLIEPDHKVARNYIQKIKATLKPTTTSDKKKEAVDLVLSQLEEKTPPKSLPKDVSMPLTEKIQEKKEEKIKIKGEAVLSLGMTSQDVIWKRANADLNEKNWRILSFDGFNKGINTYDSRTYDRLRLEVDTLNKEGLNFHTNIAIDPWSFVGKSDKVTVTSSWGDTAEIELKYWANTGYTISETVYTDRLGNSFNLPEIKIQDNWSHPLSLTTSGWWPWFDQFNIPALKIKREFKPLREFWFDYSKENLNLRFFPLGLENQAPTTDDPLRLSNHHIWWQPSPWILRWFPGRYNPGGGDYTKGFWDDSLAYLVRDSSGERLTFLRGLSFAFSPEEEISISSTFASPLHLWQDYDYFDSLASSNRLKYRISDNLKLGALYNFRIGFNENKKDLTNHVWGVDLGYEIKEGIKLDLEFATSRTSKDLNNSEYSSKLRGKAFYFSLTGSLPAKKIIDLEYGYNELKPKEESFFTKWRLYLAHMDRNFESTLANYRETRDDSFWSRHIHFREPLQYYYTGLYGPALSWEEIEPFKIGDGIDIGRDVIGFRIETSLWDKKIDNLFDVRNVHSVKGKFIENVVRDEFSFQVNERLTTKLLGIYHRLPKTKAGIDPFLFDADTGNYLLDWSADPIDDAKDPTLKTGSLGLEYKFFEWLSLNGIWEYTNDYTLAYDNFPRGILNSSQMASYIEDGKTYRFNQTYLYDQQYFPQPPYPFYNIFKTGLKFIPIEKLEIYLDYTRNEFKSAGPIDDNMNHIGIELSFLPNKKVGLYLRYVYSRWNDLDLLLNDQEKCYRGHHNFFSELRYKFSQDDELIMQYGESGISPVSWARFDPFGTGLLTIDTQHIFRIYYRKKF